MVESTARPATRWGILGTGGIARQFTQDLLLAGHTVTAVGSRTRENAEQFAARFELPAAHASYESLVADPSVDLVYVATPHPFHYPNATLALEAGKHVLVEKPFTLNATQAQHLVTHAADKGLLILEAMWTRWLPHMARLREIVAAGTIGELRSMSADHTQRLPDDPGHRLNALELGGGALLDLGVYPVSFASDLFGAPQSIQAVATFKETGADAQVATTFRYAGGQIATTYSASTTRGPNVAVLLGSEGRIEIDSVWYTATGLRVYDADDTLVEDARPLVEGRGMQYQAAEAERLLSEGRIASDILPTQETVAIMATLDAVREQIGLRYPGELPPADQGEDVTHLPRQLWALLWIGGTLLAVVIGGKWLILRS
ncbi:MAG TPA: Gfo/Idh/MocA family oxidoreductase [Trebonia sp.]|nr:Gfo/Idh/MocA family oxidoreductase [Trebonia sp.]